MNQVQRTELRKGENILKFDYSKLRGRIVECNGSIRQFCQSNNLCVQNFSAKLNNRARFSIEDAISISKALDIPQSDVADYFFVEKV